LHELLMVTRDSWKCD